MRRIITLGGLVAALAMMVSPALAGTVLVQDGAYGTTNGGVFSVTPSGIPYHPDGVPFDTFCVETNETLSFGNTYDVILNTAAVYNNAPGGSNPLEPESAYLFALWNGFGGGIVHNDANADLIQNALWWLEGQGGANNALVAQAQAAVLPAGVWYAAYGNTIGPVLVMNLYTLGHAGEYDYRVQDLLVMVPVPGAALLGVLGLSLVGWVKRRLA